MMIHKQLEESLERTPPTSDEALSQRINIKIFNSNQQMNKNCMQVLPFRSEEHTSELQSRP